MDIEFNDPPPPPRTPQPTLTMDRAGRTDYEDAASFEAAWATAGNPQMYQGSYSKYVWFSDAVGHHHALPRYCFADVSFDWAQVKKTV